MKTTFAAQVRKYQFANQFGLHVSPAELLPRQRAATPVQITNENYKKKNRRHANRYNKLGQL